MQGDLLQSQPEVPEQQQVLNEFSQEELRPEDQEALQQLQGELNDQRAPVLPEGTAQHLDAQGNVLTPEEYEAQQANRAAGERDEYGQGGSRS